MKKGIFMLSFIFLILSSCEKEKSCEKNNTYELTLNNSSSKDMYLTITINGEDGNYTKETLPANHKIIVVDKAGYVQINSFDGTNTKLYDFTALPCTQQTVVF